jgi:hypothetical protein
MCSSLYEKVTNPAVFGVDKNNFIRSLMDAAWRWIMHRLMSQITFCVRMKTWLRSTSHTDLVRMYNLQVKYLQETSGHLNLTRWNDNRGSIVPVSSGKTKECNWMADSTPFRSSGYEEKNWFIQMVDGGVEIVTVCMSWTSVNRYSAFLSTL